MQFTNDVRNFLRNNTKILPKKGLFDAHNNVQQRDLA